MIRFVTILTALFYSISAFSHVCTTIESIPGFSSSLLFDEAIINHKPLDYYSFSSYCNSDCLKYKFIKNNISFKISNNVLSVFDIESVATISFEYDSQDFSKGYLTCSSTQNRTYITHPLKLKSNKVSLDLQTQHFKTISRTINLQGYTKREYTRLINRLDVLAESKRPLVGFMEYKIPNANRKLIIKITRLNHKGEFMIIIEGDR